jgi:hypothetical protein
LRSARIAAIAERRRILFEGDAETGGYRIDGRHHRLLTGREARALRIATADGLAIAFFPSGGSSGGRVILRGAQTRAVIDIDPLTGHADLAP